MRRADGTAFPMLELVGTIYSNRVRKIRPAVNYGTYSHLNTTEVLTDVLTELDNPGTRSGLVNPRKESGQFSVVENGSLLAPMIGKYYPSLLCDVRPLLMNTTLYARVQVTDVIGDLTQADLCTGTATRTTTMPPRVGEYICMRASDFVSSFGSGSIRVGGGIWTLKHSTVIFIERAETPTDAQAALWVESHLPRCVEIEDTYPIPVAAPPGTGSTKKAVLNILYVESNAEVGESQVILVAVDRTATQIQIGSTVVNVQTPAIQFL